MDYLEFKPHPHLAKYHTLTDLFGNQFKELEERLYNANDNPTRTAITDQFLLQRLNDTLYDVRFTEKCVPALLVP